MVFTIVNYKFKYDIRLIHKQIFYKNDNLNEATEVLITKNIQIMVINYLIYEL